MDITYLHQLRSSQKLQRGHALITLLFFTIIGMSVIASATAVLIANSISTTITDHGQVAYYYAESGAEDALLRLLRNPTYSGSYQTLPAGEGYAYVTVNSGVIVSIGTSGNTVRKIQVQTTYSQGIVTILSWKEIQ